jgi:hypothetical protein
MSPLLCNFQIDNKLDPQGFSKQKSDPKFVLFEKNFLITINYSLNRSDNIDVEEFKKPIPLEERKDDPLLHVIDYWKRKI